MHTRHPGRSAARATVWVRLIPLALAAILTAATMSLLHGAPAAAGESDAHASLHAAGHSAAPHPALTAARPVADVDAAGACLTCGDVPDQAVLACSIIIAAIALIAWTRPRRLVWVAALEAPRPATAAPPVTDPRRPDLTALGICRT